MVEERQTDSSHMQQPIADVYTTCKTLVPRADINMTKSSSFVLLHGSLQPAMGYQQFAVFINKQSTLGEKISTFNLANHELPITHFTKN